MHPKGGAHCPSWASFEAHRFKPDGDIGLHLLVEMSFVAESPSTAWVRLRRVCKNRRPGFAITPKGWLQRAGTGASVHRRRPQLSRGRRAPQASEGRRARTYIRGICHEDSFVLINRTKKHLQQTMLNDIAQADAAHR
jgi:hypothetical protein